MVRKNLGPRPAFAGFALIQLVGPGEKKGVNIIKKKKIGFNVTIITFHRTYLKFFQVPFPFATQLIMITVDI